MRYQLVIQLPEGELNFDDLIELEDVLIEKLDDDVDGHDIGSGEINFFIFTDDPKKTFKKAKTIMKKQKQNLKAAYREIGAEEYNILWPSTLKEFHII